MFFVVLGIAQLALIHSGFRLGLGIGYLVIGRVHGGLALIFGPAAERRERERDERELAELRERLDRLTR